MAASAFDEMGESGAVRPQYAQIAQWLADTPGATLELKRREA